jgi:AcrR family transcriptional regulator
MYDRPPGPAPASARTNEILLRARRAFIEKGFDAASMQDLARAAGMSVGNFYRYFPSKEAIVEAMVIMDMEEIEREFGPIFDAPDPLAALREGIAYRVHGGVLCQEEGVLWADINAAATRKPAIAAIEERMEAAICEKLQAIFRLSSRRDDAASEARFALEAHTIFFLVKSSHTQAQMLGRNPAVAARVMAMIDDCLLRIHKDT